jgi:hypothetical protein
MSLERFQLPYMTTAQREAITPNDKDLLFDTDLHKIFIGNGSTLGGLELGTQGEPGLDITWLGAYVAETEYQVNDAVSYLGSAYICKLISTGNLPTDTTHWDLMAEKGDTGDPGVVESVVAGTNVTVDNTDPANPIVSAAGGGGGEWELISKGRLASPATTLVDITGISTDYDLFRLRIIGRAHADNANPLPICMRLNNDSGNHYEWVRVTLGASGQTYVDKDAQSSFMFNDNQNAAANQPFDIEVSIGKVIAGMGATIRANLSNSNTDYTYTLTYRAWGYWTDKTEKIDQLTIFGNGVEEFETGTVWILEGCKIIS